MPILLNLKMWDKTPCLYIFQNEGESQNIWDKIFNYKSLATKHFIQYVLAFIFILKSK